MGQFLCLLCNISSPQLLVSSLKVQRADGGEYVPRIMSCIHHLVVGMEKHSLSQNQVKFLLVGVVWINVCVAVCVRMFVCVCVCVFFLRVCVHDTRGTFAVEMGFVLIHHCLPSTKNPWPQWIVWSPQKTSWKVANFVVSRTFMFESKINDL